VDVLARCTPYQQQDAGVGAGVGGGISGALLDQSNPWHDGLRGAALGSVMGATHGDIFYRSSPEAAATRPSVCRTQDSRGVYHAEPVHDDERTRRKKVREWVWKVAGS